MIFPWIILDGLGTPTDPDANTPITWPDGYHDSPWASGEHINGRSEKLFEKRLPPHRFGKRFRK